MTMLLLRKLSVETLPFVVEGNEDVDSVHILKVAGHVEAVLAKAIRTPLGWMSPVATVTKIIRSGRRMLRLFPLRPEN
jgi:hypothetical protein